MTGATEEELAAIAAAIGDPEHPAKRSAAEWATEHLGRHDRIAADLDSSFARDDWRRLAEYGAFRLLVPADQGGAGVDLATALLTLEGLGYGSRDNGLLFAASSQMCSTQYALSVAGTDEQRERWLEPMMRGEALGAFAITEPEVGSDAYAISMTAERRDDGSYVLNGHKAYITLGSRCDLIVVFASTKPGAGRWGLSAFVVPTDLDGVERLPNRDKMGMRTTPFGDVTFTDVVVPGSALLGREGSGASIFNSVIEIERSFVFTPAIGAMERVLDDTIRYANEREQGGVTIGHHQAVAHRIADMKQQHESARLFLYRAAIAHVTGNRIAISAALAKLVASETGIAATLAAVAVHGAKGYVSEFEVERDLRDAVGGVVYSGTSDIQRNIVARLLGLG